MPNWIKTCWKWFGGVVGFMLAVPIAVVIIHGTWGWMSDKIGLTRLVSSTAAPAAATRQAVQPLALAESAPAKEAVVVKAAGTSPAVHKTCRSISDIIAEKHDSSDSTLESEGYIKIGSQNGMPSWSCK